MTIHTFFGFRNGKLITVVQSTSEEYDNAVDVDYSVANPQEAEKQIAEWKSEHQ